MMLEGQLNSFSFEELTMSEAAQLKKSFIFFKDRLEEKVYRIKSNHTAEVLDKGTINSHESQDSIVNPPVQINNGLLMMKIHQEFKTPINEILGFADWIMEGNLDREQRAQIKKISKVANHLSETLNELQEYIILATGAEKFEMIDFNFFRIIKDTLVLCNALIVQKEVKLSVEIEEQVPTFLNGDPSKLSQILLYLLGNTIKYTQEGTIHLRISLHEDFGDSCSLKFQIRHKGIGQFPIDLAHFYNALNETETSSFEKLSQGGFGMYIIKELIKNSEGSIPKSGTIGLNPAFLFNITCKRGTETKSDHSKIPSVPIAHLGKIWQECTGDIVLLEEMVNLFKKNILECIGKLKIYLPLGEFEKIQTAAQQVRANADLIQANNLLPLIDSLITNCSTARDIHFLNGIYDQFLSTYPLVEQAIDKELRVLKNMSGL